MVGHTRHGTDCCPSNVENTMKWLLAGAVILTLAACQPAASPSPEVPELTREYGCGFGFYLGDADQTTGLIVEYADFDDAMEGRVTNSAALKSDAWTAHLDFGRDLFANWCDDVLEPDEPTPEVDESWEVTGTIDVVELPEPGACGPATARLTGLEARNADGEVLALGDFEVDNEFWGCIAG